MIGRIDVQHVTGEHRPGQSFRHHVGGEGQRGLHVLGEARVVQCRPGLVVAGDQPGVMAVDERDGVHGATGAYRGEQRERVVPVVSAPRPERGLSSTSPLVILAHSGSAVHPVPTWRGRVTRSADTTVIRWIHRSADTATRPLLSRSMCAGIPPGPIEQGTTSS